MTAPELLRRKADDYRALCSEHATGSAESVPYKLVELVLREVADAIEQAAAELEREAA